MPVTKYRSAFDMGRPARVVGDPAPHIRAVFARATLLASPAPRRGVQRFRSIEAANAARERETLQRMKRTAPERTPQTQPDPEPNEG